MTKKRTAITAQPVSSSRGRDHVDTIDTIDAVQRDILLESNPEKARILQRFFKTGKGEYAEGDEFRGVTVPVLRRIARRYTHLPPQIVVELMQSKIHEERFVGVRIYVDQYGRASEPARNRLVRRYIRLIDRCINNWDLVDTSAECVVGEYAYRTGDTETLYALARSRSLWRRRVSIVASFFYIKKGESAVTFRLARILLTDDHDLIHKAVGWMLREVGKRSGTQVLCGFLDTYAHRMPRTMLRYAVEHLPQTQQKKYRSM